MARRRRKAKSETVEWVQSIVIAVILALLIRGFVFETILVDGESMLPTLNNADRLVVNKISHKINGIERGDIIIFKYPDNENEHFVKRVIACGGDVVKIQDGRVYVNGQQLNEPYVLEETDDDFPESTVPEDTVFVLGDNRGNSRDSRDPRVGFVPVENIIGKPWARIWPLKDMKLLN
ncbi:MAG TPA: signal peptidase I [Clostridiales bacterium]|nr:signal peptidase I [Clostridiales bacterium]